MRKLEPGSGALTDYYDWFRQAGHGESVVYHTGDLHNDRDPETANPERAAQAGALSALATRILKDQKDGYLVLTQKRLGFCRYEYRATRVRSTAEPVRSVSPVHAQYAPAA